MVAAQDNRLSIHRPLIQGPLLWVVSSGGDCWNSFLFVVVVFNLSAWLSLGKGLRLVHKRPQGEVAAAGAPQGKQLRRWR